MLAWFVHFVGTIKPIYSLSGFVVGVLVGMTGAGGGSLMTPLLVLAFGIHPSTAVGTDLLYSAATKTVGTGVHGFVRTIDWRIVGWLAAGSVPASVATILILSRFERDVAVSANHLITTVLGFALIATAIAIMFRKHIIAFFHRRTGGEAPQAVTSLTIVLGAALGVLVSVSSVGAGALGVTALLILYPNLPAAKVVGSDIAHAVPLSLIAGLGQWMIGSVNLGLLASLLVGSIPGIIIGSLFAARAPDRVLRPIMAATLALVGGRLAF
jgi:uncharacterized membrane protein YfcA